MRTNELILYRYMEHEDLLRDMTFLIDNADNDYYNKEDLKSLLFENLNELIELAAKYGFEGNLWHTFLTFLLANSEKHRIMSTVNCFSKITTQVIIHHRYCSQFKITKRNPHWQFIILSISTFSIFFQFKIFSYILAQFFLFIKNIFIEIIIKKRYILLSFLRILFTL